MIPHECEFESEVLAAALQGRWPERVDPQLRAHAAACRACSDVAAIAGAIEDSRKEISAQAVIPNSGRVWWLAQLRARREAAESANRPLTAVQIVAFVCAAGLLVACLRAASAWLSPLVGRLASGMWEHSVLALATAAILFLVPAGVYLALGRD
jgi:predicted anti-sigma-YlaC factor YlaD